MHFTAAMPLFEMSTLRMGLVPPSALQYSATLFQLSEAARWRRGAPPTPRPGELGGDRSALLLGGRCEAMVRGVDGRKFSPDTAAC